MNRLEVLERLAVAVRAHRRVEMAYLSHSGSCRICDEQVGDCETGGDLWAEATIKQLDVWNVLIELESAFAEIPDPIRVWRFELAPAEYRALSPFGGDEDWVGFVPRAVWKNEGGQIDWMGTGGRPFGMYRVHYEQIVGGVVAIGAHA